MLPALQVLRNFGINNRVLTEKFGPGVRFASIFTAADIPPDPVTEKPLCTQCMQCVNACPVKAVDGREYPEGLTDKKSVPHGLKRCPGDSFHPASSA